MQISPPLSPRRSALCQESWPRRQLFYQLSQQRHLAVAAEERTGRGYRGHGSSPTARTFTERAAAFRALIRHSGAIAGHSSLPRLRNAVKIAWILAPHGLLTLLPPKGRNISDEITKANAMQKFVLGKSNKRGLFLPALIPRAASSSAMNRYPNKPNICLAMRPGKKPRPRQRHRHRYLITEAVA